MADIRLVLQVRFANGQHAAFLDVRATEGGRSYALGKTGADGRINRILRPRRKLLGIDDPADNPTLQVTVSDLDGRSASRAVPPTPFPPPVFVLPPTLSPPADEAPTVPAGAAGSPSAVADQALRPLVSPNAPGHVLLVRRDGAPWADATRGLARVAAPGVSARAMTNDTIVHLASMSKPVTATAVVALLEDWVEMRDAVAAIGTPGTPTVQLSVSIPGRPQTDRRTLQVPRVLAPLFSDRMRARSFVDGAWPQQVGPDLRAALSYFVHGGLVSPRPAIPPGHLGLLRRVFDGVAVPTFGSPFLPLIRDRLGAGQTIGAGVAAITIGDLLRHGTNISSFAIASTGAEPAGGVAQVDYWAELRQLLALPCNRTAPPNRSYANHNYTLLTAVVDACTDMRFDDYLTQRLFLDPRFNRIRRRVVEPALGALYYQGTTPNWTGGAQYPDYSNWPGNGGLFATANQLTDWMHALYTREPVAQVSGARPLLSTAGIDRLFGATGYFSGGIPSRPAPPVTAQRRYQHNGGTSVAGGDVNGNVAIVIGPSGSVYTALYVANGRLGADPPFEAAVGVLPWT